MSSAAYDRTMLQYSEADLKPGSSRDPDVVMKSTHPKHLLCSKKTHSDYFLDFLSYRTIFTKCSGLLLSISQKVIYSLVLTMTLLSANAVQQVTPPPTPIKLIQGCSPDLLHSRALRAVQVACRSQPATVVAAFEGVQDAMAQCADRMRFQQWDCSDAGNIMLDPPILKYAYRESALVWALSSAGAAWGVATACAQGWIADCACTQSGQSGWEYGGCSYGVQHGITVSRKLLTRSTISRSPLRKIEKHNLKAGRLAVKKTLISSCKCHGVSGSCQQKTCWKKTATLDHITDYLVEKYARSCLFVNDAPVKNADLVYLEPSPDPCHKKGAEQRICAWRNETHAQGDCGKLCCGRGFKITHEVIHYKCDCKFVWCCKLVCKDCLQHRWVSTCN